MKGYKGFNPGLICKDKQYQENTVFEEPEAKICEKGMHFCENPFDVLNYYDLIRSDGTPNEFAEVEALDEPKTDDKEKFCSRKLKIGVKLGLSGFIKACVDFVLEKTIAETPSENVDSGYSARIGSSGYSAQIGSSGYYARIGSSGDSAQIGSSGYYAQIGSSGDSAQIGSSGDSARIGSSGDSARINCTGSNSVICCAGHGSVAKAPIGCWITLAEWKYDGAKRRYVPVCVKTEYVDGEKIKADTPYMLKNGEFVEAESDGE
jgi:hypothetical protein